MATEKMYVIYVMHIDCIQSFSFNHWIKLNFDSKWVLNSKILSCTFSIFFSYVLDFQKMLSRFQLTAYLSCLIYITLLGERCWKVAHMYHAFTLLCKITSFAPTKILTLIQWLKQHLKYIYNELKLKKFSKKLRQQFNRIMRIWKKSFNERLKHQFNMSMKNWKKINRVMWEIETTKTI
jgi:hypothetical protein